MFIWSLLLTVMVSGLVVAHATFMAATRRELKVRYENVTLSDSFARSGLVDALAWFRGRPTQPVGEFAPQLDPTGDPPLLETLDPTVGLVREFEVRGELWARYEVRHDDVSDVSESRGIATPGSVWDVGARAFVYRNLDPSRPFDSPPNRIVARSYYRSELQGIGLRPPSTAAVVVGDAAGMGVGPAAGIEGGDHPAVAYRAGTAPVLPADQVSGSPRATSLVGYDDSAEQVFGMHEDQLRSLSDHVLRGDAIRDGGGGVTWVTGARRFVAGRGQSDLPPPPQELHDAAVYVGGSLVLGADRPLVGRAMVAVDGDLTVNSDNQSRLEGLVWVSGDATIDGDFELNGTLVVRGRLRLGYGTGRPHLRADPHAVAALKHALERYRLSRATRPGWWGSAH